MANSQWIGNYGDAEKKRRKGYEREYTPGPRGEIKNMTSPNRLPSSVSPSEQMGRYGRGGQTTGDKDD